MNASSLFSPLFTELHAVEALVYLQMVFVVPSSPQHGVMGDTKHDAPALLTLIKS